MERVTLKGAFSSPYALKMRAVLRYRRIPYRWVLRNSPWDDLPEAPTGLRLLCELSGVRHDLAVVHWLEPRVQSGTIRTLRRVAREDHDARWGRTGDV